MVAFFPRSSFKQQNLEQRQADVEYELRCLLNKPGECGPTCSWTQAPGPGDSKSPGRGRMGRLCEQGRRAGPAGAVWVLTGDK